MSDRVPEDMPDRMPENLPDRMPEDMPEDMPDHMPEDMPDRKCINVMVGITRSKVFFLKQWQWEHVGTNCNGSSMAIEWVFSINNIRGRNYPTSAKKY